MGAGRVGWFSGLRRRLVGGVTDLLDVLGLVLVVAGVWTVLGVGAALLASGAGVLLVSRGLTIKVQQRRQRQGSEVA